MNKAKVGRRYIAFVGAPMAAVAQGRESVPRASRNRGSGVSGEATFLPFAPLVLVTLWSTISSVKSSAA